MIAWTTSSAVVFSVARSAVTVVSSRASSVALRVAWLIFCSLRTIQPISFTSCGQDFTP